MHVLVSNPYEQLFNGKAKSVNAPGTEGEFTVLPHHMAFISLLKKGDIRLCDEEGYYHDFPVQKGVLEVRNNKVTVLL